jgi:hypothetical protein
VTLLDITGYRIVVTTRDTAELAPEQANNLALSVAVLGRPDDPAQWTTDPLR